MSPCWLAISVELLHGVLVGFEDLNELVIIVLCLLHLLIKLNLAVLEEPVDAMSYGLLHKEQVLGRTSSLDLVNTVLEV